MKTVLTVFILIAMGCSSQPNKNNIDKSAIPLIDSFFKNIQTKDAVVALDQLLGSNSNINLKDSATVGLKDNFTLINDASGTYMGYRLLKKRFIENDIGIYSYLAKYEKKFYRFVFMFYNNGNSVKLYKFLFDDDIDIELEGSLKFYTN
ncbi:MAG TPA: hypothetical protein VJU78_19855 [Chitinophagaceae bacterium]|nr:hypothetical protein [Chitinophagaceae bacterium]